MLLAIGDFRIGGIRFNLVEMSKAKPAPASSPGTYIQEGISLFAGWGKGQDVEKDDIEASIEESRMIGLVG
jgi:hypothetical protein